MMSLKGAFSNNKEKKFMVFVCTGNTCRSPMAEGIANHLFQKEGLAEMWYALSAGTAVYGRYPAASCAIEVMRELGVDISAHRTKSIRELPLFGDVVFVGMTEAHVQAVIAEGVCPKDYAIRLFDLYLKCGGSKERASSMFLCDNGDVPDPFGSSYKIYLDTAITIKNLLLPVIETIRQSHGSLPLSSFV